ncbi:MAG TPA: hypothetical protein VE959_38090 [Bryobacteraceae bacterium]|nr:hypothetical protein [Bryobacteraceae bacterium]
MKLSRPAVLVLASALLAQQKAPKAPVKPVQAQSPSEISYSTAADGSQTVEIRNVSYEITGTDVPGRPRPERLLVRKTIHSKQTLGDIGSEGTVTLDAWRLGDDLRQKPIYTVAVSGSDGHVVENALLVVSRGLEEVEWWSLYKLGSGQHLLDTYVPPISFSISRETMLTRYAGLEVPPDDTADPRLKQPGVVGVLSYASASRVIREALLTCDDPKRAQLLRSFADMTRTVSFEEGPAAARTLRLRFSQNYPSPPNTVEILIPVLGDDLDLAHAHLPPRMHATAWRR